LRAQITHAANACHDLCMTHRRPDVGHHDGKFVVVPSLCKTPAPLQEDAAHAPYVHTAWPKTVARRLCQLGSPSLPPTCIKMKLMDLYRQANASDSTLSIMSEECNQFPWPPPRTQAPSGNCSSEVLWLCLGFSPALHSIAHKFLNLAPKPCGLDARIRIAWRNEIPNLDMRIKKHNAATMGVRCRSEHFRLF